MVQVQVGSVFIANNYTNTTATDRCKFSVLLWNNDYIKNDQQKEPDILILEFFPEHPVTGELKIASILHPYWWLGGLGCDLLNWGVTSLQ